MTGAARAGVHLLVALLLGTLAGWGAVAALTELRGRDAGAAYADLPPPRDRVRDAIEGLREDGVHVAPDGRPMLDEAGERAVEEAVARHRDVPVYVVVWAPSRQVGNDTFTVQDQLVAALGDEQAMFVIWEGPQAGEVFSSGGYARISEYGGAYDFAGDPATTLPDVVEAYQQAEWADPDESDYWGGIAGGSVIGVILGGVLVVAGIVLGAAVRRSSGGSVGLPGSWFPPKEEGKR